MPYFPNYPTIDYRFGSEAYIVKAPNLAAYSQIIDDTKNSRSLYADYTILDGQRADHVSQALYDTPKYHWTFFYMNDHLRESGWPLDQVTIDRVIKKNHPNVTLTTTDDIFSTFLVGSIINGGTSSARGTIVRRNLDMGQIIVQPDIGSQSWIHGELATVREPDEDLVTREYNITIHKTKDEADGFHHYESLSTNEHVDIDPTTIEGLDGPPGVTGVTIRQLYNDRNDLLKKIRVIKPSAIRQIAKEFESVMSQ